ncbi:MAG: glycosyltransferase [Lachnospiraceae bacterium]|nr:glycosyltransferase [Lachnospiraceae bacterium]
MAQKILSIVIPTYNMEDYLPRCLDSVTREDVPDSLEVIVVNDGSKDRSLEIAKEYQAKRPDIIQIIDKSNGHYGSCINAALKTATGKYFRPLDADDWFDTNALIEFLNNLSEINDDLIFTSHTRHRKTRVIDVESKEIPYNTAFSVQDNSIIERLPSAYISMHGITYKLQILKDCKLALSEGVCYTDSEYIFLPLRHTKTFRLLNLSLYNYDMTRDNQSVNPTVAAKNHSQFASVLKRMLGVSNPYSLLEKKILCSCLRCYFYWLLFFCSADKELKEMDYLLQQKDFLLKKMVYKDLMYAPLIWKFTGTHFFWYEKLKKILKIDR